MKLVRRCSASFSRFTHGKIGAKFAEYTSSDEEEEKGLSVDPVKIEAFHLTVGPDLLVKGGVMDVVAVVVKEGPSKVVVGKEEPSGVSDLVEQGGPEAAVALVKAPDSLEVLNEAFPESLKPVATAESSGRKKSVRSVFTNDYSDWDPTYLSYLRDKYPDDFPSTN